ncbi:hypothetical protein NPIL_176801 [Nephila pilipes]|uniref:Uncharacterized protein n=1 Tax=Nephila pilipes TaxID=299642 RepID=A0A8X6UJ68_NEPPI|nr:hypothetical protein NPIL_176801 [Nephila pilipes]
MEFACHALPSLREPRFGNLVTIDDGSIKEGGRGSRDPVEGVDKIQGRCRALVSRREVPRNPRRELYNGGEWSHMSQGNVFCAARATT